MFTSSLFLIPGIHTEFLLRSHQAWKQTKTGRVRDQPGLPVPEASLI